MPKRSLDVTDPVTMAGERPARRTERSHEENQERAYIAASRRADRSIEARVQSARMASEIHKKRTGKGFKISDEIVMKEEMYEEEEDDLPRSYRMLVSRTTATTPEADNRVTSYLSSRVAMAGFQYHDEVNRIFEAQFPNAGQISQQLAQSMYYQPLQNGQSSPNSPHFPPGNTYSPYPRDRSHSIPQLSIPLPVQSPPLSRHASLDEHMSTPALTPGSANSDTSRSHSSTRASFSRMHSFPTSIPVNPSLPLMNQRHGQSLFSSELSTETKMMVNLDFDDPLSSAFCGGSDMMGSEYFMNHMNHGLAYGQYIYPDSLPRAPAKAPDSRQEVKDVRSGHSKDYTAEYIGVTGSRSGIGTPGGSAGDAWEEWIQGDDWISSEQQQERRC